MIRPASFRVSGASFRITAQAVTPNAGGTFSTYLAGQLLNHAFVSARSFVPPPAIYAALYSNPPTASGGGTEISGDPNYSRLPISFGAASGAPATIQNSAQVTWPVATTDWGFVSAIGLLDASTAGNLLAFGLMLAPDGVTVAPKAVQAGDIFVITVGAFVVGLG